jgi:hypothetical protein
MPAASPNQAGSPVHDRVARVRVERRVERSDHGSPYRGVAATMRRAMSEHTERLQKLRERVLAAKEFL